MTESDVPAEVLRLLRWSEQINTQRQAIADEFVHLHDPATDYEVDELRQCVLDSPTNEDYAACLVRIMNHRYPVELEEEAQEEIG